MVELLSPIALLNAQAAVSYESRGLIAPIELQVLISSYSYSGRRGGRYSVKRYSYSMAV